MGTAEVEPRTVYLTPLLLAGEHPETLGCMPAETVEQALTLMRQGETALVPTLDMARLVLATLGLSADEIDERVHFGLTGQVLYGI